MTTKRIVGTLCAFAETGTEGIFWAVTDNDVSGWDALNILEDGDYLFVANEDSGIEWEGIIDFDLTVNRAPLPVNPSYICQRIDGCSVHGVQVGVDPDTWLRWFFEERPAVLYKKGT